MAERAPVTDERAAAFVAACLAPLPEGSGPVDGPALRRQIKRHHRERWWRGMLHVWAAEHEHKAANFRRLIALHEGRPEPSCHRQWLAFVRAVDVQMRIPAGRLGDLKWKREHCGILGGRPEEWEELIAADEARLTLGSAERA
jgi:hypothetical protein